MTIEEMNELLKSGEIKKLNEVKGLEHLKKHYYIRKNADLVSICGNKVRIMKPGTVRGYHQIGLATDNGQKMFYIHRLVSMAFIPNPENKPDVNHLNEVPTDNYLENLEWATRSENIRHSQLGPKSVMSKPKEHYATNPTPRGNFKTTCRKQGWVFDNFEEEFAKWHVYPNGTRRRKYLYVLKEDEQNVNDEDTIHLLKGAVEDEELDELEDMMFGGLSIPREVAHQSTIGHKDVFTTKETDKNLDY